MSFWKAHLVNEDSDIADHDDYMKEMLARNGIMVENILPKGQITVVLQRAPRRHCTAG